MLATKLAGEIPLAEIVNSGLTVKDNVAICDVKPAVPTMWRVYTPDGVDVCVETTSVLVPRSPGVTVKADGFKLAARPVPTGMNP